MNFFYTQFINRGVHAQYASRNIFFSKLLIFGTMGFSGTRNRLAQVPRSEKIFMIPYRGTPCGNFFGPRDMRQSISRPRKPSSTKNQPIWSQNNKVEKIDFFHGVPPIGGHKNFFGTRDLRQSISRAQKPPSTKSQLIWRKIIFFEKRTGRKLLF